LFRKLKLSLRLGRIPLQFYLLWNIHFPVRDGSSNRRELFMKKFAFIVSAIALISSIGASAGCPALCGDDLANQIPEIGAPEAAGFQKVPDVAQYKMADWSGVVGIARNISRREAAKIAAENSEISFFFYTKGYQMVLETESGDYRVFRHGDTVFFKGQPWWGSAPGLADGYVKIQ
jgi:hypothetical protein